MTDVKATAGIRDRFRKLGEGTAQAVGTPAAFLLALTTVAVWAISGPYFHYSDTWQLVINTGTTIVTFLVVFLIQNTQNRDTRIMNLKLDELLRAVEGARTAFVGLNDMTDDELENVHSEFKKLGDRVAPLLRDDIEMVERELDVRREKGRKKK